MKDCSKFIKRLGLNDEEAKVFEDELMKKTEAVEKIKDFQKQIEENKKVGRPSTEQRKLLADYRKTLNDVKNELKSDYQRYAKDIAEGNLSRMKNRDIHDKIAKDPKLLEKILTNKSMAHKYNINAQRFALSQDFRSYMKAFSDIHPNNKIFTLNDDELFNTNNEHVKEFNSYIRKEMDRKYLTEFGQNYFKDDNQHLIKLNYDKLRSTDSKDDFVRNVYSNTQADKMLLHQYKYIEDKIVGLNVDGSIGAVRKETRLGLFQKMKDNLGVDFNQDVLDGLLKNKADDILDFEKFKKIYPMVEEDSPDYTITKQLYIARENAINETYLKALNDFVEDVKSGNKPKLSLSKPIFKSNEHYNHLLHTWATNKSSSVNYMSNIRQYNSIVALRSIFGYVPDVRSFSNKAFRSGFTKQMAENYVDSFLGIQTRSSEKELAWLKRLSLAKNLAVSSKGLLLPVFSVTDSFTRTFIELMKNNQLNFFSDTVGSFKRSLDAFVDAGITAGKVGHSTLKSQFKGIKDLPKVLQNNTLNQVDKLQELLHSIGEYENISNIEMNEDSSFAQNAMTGFLQKFTGKLEQINDKLVYQPMRGADDTQRLCAWDTTVKTLKRFNPDVDSGIIQRAKNLGLTKDDLLAMKNALIKDDVGSAIEDIKNEEIRNNLYKLRYNTDLSAIPLDITPMNIFQFNSRFARSLFGFFWGFHVKTTTQLLDTLRYQSTLGAKISGLSAILLGGMPINMALNYAFDYMYTGKTNPFDNVTDGTAFIATSLMGNFSRLGMVALGALGFSGYESNPLTNPLLSGVSSIGRSTINEVKHQTSNDYTDEQNLKANINLAKSVLSFVPLGNIGKFAINQTYQ